MRKILTVAMIIMALVIGGYLGYINGNRNQLPKGPLLAVDFLTERFGNAIIVKTPEGKVTVIDPGPRKTEDALVRYLKSINVKTFSIIISNPANEHSGCIRELVDRFPISQIMFGENAEESTSWKNIQGRIREKNIPQVVLSAGDTVKLSQSTKLEVLSPPKGLLKSIDYSSDNNSLIIRMSFRGKRFLLTSDIRTEAEANLIQSRIDSSSDVLVVPHHAQRGSTSLEMLSVVRPEYCVISSSGFARPNTSVLRRLDPKNTGAPLYRTDKDGIIEIVTNGRTTVVNTNQSDRR